MSFFLLQNLKTQNLLSEKISDQMYEVRNTWKTFKRELPLFITLINDIVNNVFPICDAIEKWKYSGPYIAQTSKYLLFEKNFQ